MQRLVDSFNFSCNLKENRQQSYTGSNITLSTLFEIVEKGLGGKVNITIDV